MKIAAAGDIPNERHYCHYNLVTSRPLYSTTDTRVENHLMKGLSAAFPDHAFIGEEESSAGEGVSAFPNRPTWIIDPIDGAFCPLNDLILSISE